MALQSLRQIAAVGCPRYFEAFVAQSEDDIVQQVGVVFDHKYVNHRGSSSFR